MDRGRPRWPAALVAAVVVAQAAVVLLRPREGVIEPAHVRPQSYFSDSQIERARDFRRPQLALHGGVLFAQLALLAALVARPPRLLHGSCRRPLLAVAGAGAALSLTLSVVALPFDAIARERAIDVGLVTQSRGGYAGDQVKSWGIAAVIAGLGAGAAVGLMRRSPRRWWLPGSVVVVAFGAATIYAGPVLLDPLFNKFERVPAGQTRSDVLELARRAGVDVGQVYEVDASRRTTAANAYVTGLGHTKRVVLYDTLLKSFARDELRLVVAHELAHVRHSDVRNGLLYLLVVTPFGLLAVALLTRRLGGDAPKPGPAVLPALALSVAIVSAALTVVSNQLSRDVEARADSFALRLTGDPQAFVSFERGIALRNLAEPDPPGWVTFLTATHPPVIDRIGVGEAYRRGAR